jgi:hypothetical protein
MNIHMNRPTGSEAVGEIDVDKMKRYIAYCKRFVYSPFSPLPSSSAIEILLLFPSSNC